MKFETDRLADTGGRVHAGGDLTMFGPVTNLIVAESAARRGVKLEFWEYTKAGFLITIISLALGMTWLRIFIW